ALQREEILLPCRLAVQVWVHAGRDEDVALATEAAPDHLDLAGPVAGEVEDDVGLRLVERAGELVLVGAVEGDVAREGPVGTLLAAGGDRFDAAAHQLLARGDADEAGATDDKGPSQRPGSRSRRRSRPSRPGGARAPTPGRPTGAVRPCSQTLRRHASGPSPGTAAAARRLCAPCRRAGAAPRAA